MKGISGKQYTASELAKQFGCGVRTIHNHANKLFEKAQNGVTRRFDEAQATMLLESIKKSASERRGAESVDLERSVQGLETEMTDELRLAMLYKETASIERKLRGKAEARAVKAEAALGRLTVEHKDVLEANTQLYHIAEAGGLITSDREDMLALYRR
jgi:DNA-binding transcriptional MerR regulator